MKRSKSIIQFSGGLLLFAAISCSKNNPPSNPPVIPPKADTTLLTYFPFSGNALDSTSHHLDGQVVNATLTADRQGRPGLAYSFNGASSYIKLPVSPDLDLKGSLTIMAWVNPGLICGSGVGCYIVWHGDGQSAHDPFSLYSNHNAIGFRKDVGAGNQLNEVLYPVDASFTGKWAHLTGVYDTTTQTAKVYINGSLVLEKTFTGFAAINYSTDGFWTNIGAAGFGTTGENIGFFTGSIDEVRIFKRALTAAEIADWSAN